MSQFSASFEKIIQKFGFSKNHDIDINFFVSEPEENLVSPSKISEIFYFWARCIFFNSLAARKVLSL